MSHLQLRWIALAIALCATTACSQTDSPSAAQTNAGSIASTQPQASSSSDSDRPIDCSKILSSSDVSDLLTAQVTMKKTGADNNDCDFTVASGASITVAFATGSDGKFRWKTASDPTLAMVPMQGLGDKAMRRIMGEGVDVVATKGDLLCWVTMLGTNSASDTANITKLRGDALATRLGALCNKGFVAH
ncbi:MAG: hypothetical protein ABI128_05605 [Rhodanobacter sp.]